MNPIIYKGDIVEIEALGFPSWKALVICARGNRLLVRRRHEHIPRVVYKDSRINKYRLVYSASIVERLTKKDSVLLKEGILCE